MKLIKERIKQILVKESMYTINTFHFGAYGINGVGDQPVFMPSRLMNLGILG